jgi:hypothetical protein
MAMSKQIQEQQVSGGELSQDRLESVAGGLLSIGSVVASAIKGGALGPAAASSGGSYDDHLEDLEVER